MHLVQLHLNPETTTAPLINAAIVRCQEKYGSAGPVFERGPSCDSRWLVTRLSAFDSMGWIEELVVRFAKHGVTLSRTLPVWLLMTSQSSILHSLTRIG